MMLRNMAACSVWHRCTEPGQHSNKTWNQEMALPVLVARLQAAPQPPDQILLHILKTLANFAATGVHPCDTPLSPHDLRWSLGADALDPQNAMAVYNC